MSRVLLITNDDGYDARGIKVLASALDGLGDIYVVAPANEQSATSHSLTLRKKISTEKVSDRAYKVAGTPTDSVLLAVGAILGRKPDLIVSGINHGPNMGEDVTYSGTVAAAFEGTILGVPSLAISSLQRSIESEEVIGRVARSVVEAALDLGVPGECLLNVNIPDPEVSPIKGVRVTKLGTREYANDNLLRADKGDANGWSYTIGGNDPIWKDEDGTDISAVRTGYVSVTPLHLDLTHYKAVVEMERWRFDL